MVKVQGQSGPEISLLLVAPNKGNGFWLDFKPDHIPLALPPVWGRATFFLKAKEVKIIPLL